MHNMAGKSRSNLTLQTQEIGPMAQLDLLTAGNLHVNGKALVLPFREVEDSRQTCESVISRYTALVETVSEIALASNPIRHILSTLYVILQEP